MTRLRNFAVRAAPFILGLAAPILAGCGGDDSGRAMGAQPGGTGGAMASAGGGAGSATGGGQAGAGIAGQSGSFAADSGTSSVGEADSAANVIPGSDAGSSGTSSTRGTTEAILDARSATCLACAQQSGCLDPTQAGGTCEMLAGNAASGGLTEAELCRKTLNDVFTSRCFTDIIFAECLCGETALEDCLGGTAIPAGPAYADFVSDFGTDIDTISANWDLQTFGAGQAKAIVECAGQYMCDCFGN